MDIWFIQQKIIMIKRKWRPALVLAGPWDWPGHPVPVPLNIEYGNGISWLVETGYKSGGIFLSPFDIWEANSCNSDWISNLCWISSYDEFSSILMKLVTYQVSKDYATFYWQNKTLKRFLKYRWHQRCSMIADVHHSWFYDFDMLEPSCCKKRQSKS